MKNKRNLYLVLITFLVLTLIGSILFFKNRQNLDEKTAPILTEAEHLIEVREFKPALDKLNEVHRLDPMNIDAYKQMINIYIAKGRLDEAETAYEHLAKISSNKDRVDTAKQLGLAWLSVGDIEKAYKYLVVANKYSADDDVLLGLAKIAIYKQDLNKAQSYLEKVSNDKAVITLALVTYAIDKDSAKLLQSLQSTNIEKPSWVKSRITNLSEADRQDALYIATLGADIALYYQYPQLAINILQQFSDQQLENYWDALYILGGAYLELKNSDKAIDYLSRALSVGVDQPQVYNLLAIAYKSKGDLDNADKMFSTGVALCSDVKADQCKTIVTTYINYLFSKQLYVNAKKVLDSFSKSDDILILKLNAHYFLETGDLEKVQFYLKSLASQLSKMSATDKYDFYKLNLDYMLATSQFVSYEDTLEKFAKVLDGGSLNSEYQLYLAKKLLAEDQKEDAKNALYKAIDHDVSGITTSEAKFLLASL